ncbi:hypothetical protein GOV06_01005, partial [Candidatus Woesearchaeota archaeon]|nr:hypothetical protein [Candidatus Woesearchaeota archaeon]
MKLELRVDKKAGIINFEEKEFEKMEDMSLKPEERGFIGRYIGANASDLEDKGIGALALDVKALSRVNSATYGEFMLTWDACKGYG